MTKLLTITICVAMLVTLAGAAFAGQNAGGSAKFYWMTSTSVASTLRNSTASTPRGLVTCTSVTMFRGADVQIYVNANDQSGLPAAWQTEAGGPAEGMFTPKIGGWMSGSATIYPNIFTASPALPGAAVGQDGSLLYGIIGTGGCVAPHSVGVIWLSDAGSGGVARTGTKEYGVFGFTIDLSSGNANHGNVDDPVAVCLNTNWRLPCGSGEHGSVVVIVDGSAVKDYEALSSGYQWLTWGGTSGNCPYVTPVGSTTWGKVQKLYR